MKKIDINITVGGPQGGGIDTSSNMISRAFAQSGYYVFGVREYFIFKMCLVYFYEEFPEDQGCPWETISVRDYALL